MVADAIFVHGGPCDNALTLSEHAAARLKRAVELYRAGAAQVIIVALSTTQLLEFRSEAIVVNGYTDQYGELAIAYLLRRRVKPEHIRYDSRGKDTVGELYFGKIGILEPENLRSLIVVTNEFHVAREQVLAARILGPAYTITYETVRTAWDDEPYVSKQLAREASSLNLFEEQFADIAVSDDEAFGKRLIEVHPLYKV